MTFYYFYQKKTKLIVNLIFILSIILNYYIIHYVGGTKYTYIQTVYTLILMQALSMGIKGGLLSAVLGSFMLLPVLPINMYPEYHASIGDLIYTMCSFLLVGILSGYAVDIFKNNRRRVIKLLSYHYHTDIMMYNAISDEIRTEKRNQSVFIVRILNFQDIVDCLGVQIYFNYIRNVYKEINSIHVLSGDFYQIEDKTFVYVTNVLDVEEKQKMLLSVLKKNYESLHVPMTFDYAIGYTFGKNSLDFLAEEAYIASRYAEQNDRTYATYGEVKSRKQDSVLLIADFYNSMKDYDLKFFYQPIVDQDSKIVGIEALARWFHPTRGILYPQAFIPLIEQTQSINDFTLYLCHRIKDEVLPRINNKDIQVSINLSPKNLMNYQVMDELISEDIFSEHEKRKIILEVTESHMIKNHDAVLKSVLSLKNAGYFIALDDFGTGYSNLTYLHKYPLDYIKIDKTFILGIKQAKINKIVHTAIELAHNLGCKVIAEGVESKEIYDIIKQSQCDLFQGFVISKAVALEEIISKL